ncbi:hypothetical protein OB236_05960 [Paenibacillus sp. WQ 127069]|uniref:Uncharacterized protein n=1 Tax=Paenibacillus baimaensis TaxID=2982185 RepID=A0ABT2UAL1_9BACL|nr:hypothetical protein [Paenibacillus sp. WQ 127069]MCU6791672.1 hypothetical protein [Paenibacillus sp. WQ 127069]
MKSRKSHIPHTTAGKLGRLNVPQRKQDDGSGTARLTRLFADNIIGKYGFWRQDYFGRLSLVFREMAGADDEERDDGSAKWRHMVEQLKAQLAALQHSGAKQIITRTETVHRLERLIHYYSGMAGTNRNKQALVQMKPSGAAPKAMQSGVIPVEKRNQTAVSSTSTTATGKISTARLKPDTRTKLTPRDAKATKGSKKQLQQAEQNDRTRRQVAKQTKNSNTELVNRKGKRPEHSQATGQPQALEPSQVPYTGHIQENQQLAPSDRVPVQQQGLQDEGSSLVHEHKREERIPEEHVTQDQQQITEAVQNQTVNQKPDAATNETIELQNRQVMQHAPIVPSKESAANVSELSLPANPLELTTTQQGAVRWVPDNSKQRSMQISQRIGQIVHNKELNSGSTIPLRMLTQNEQISYLQRRSSNTATYPMVWRTSVGETGGTTSNKTAGRQLQWQQATPDQQSSARMSQRVVYQARSDKEIQTAMIQRQYEGMLPLGRRHASLSILSMISQATLPARTRQSGNIRHQSSSVNQQRRTTEIYSTSLNQRLSRDGRNNSFIENDNHAGKRWRGESIRHQGSADSLSPITQRKTSSFQLAHTANTLYPVSANRKLRFEQSDPWLPGNYRQYPIMQAASHSAGRNLPQIEDGGDRASSPPVGTIATYRALSIQRRQETSEKILAPQKHEPAHEQQSDAYRRVNLANRVMQQSPNYVRQERATQGLNNRTSTLYEASAFDRMAGQRQPIFRKSDNDNHGSDYQMTSPLPPLSLMLLKGWKPAVLDNNRGHELSVSTQLTSKPMTALSYTQTNVRQPYAAQDNRLSLQRNSGTLADNAAAKPMTALNYTQTNVRQPYAAQDNRLSLQRNSGTLIDNAAAKPMTALNYTRTKVRQPDTAPGNGISIRRSLGILGENVTTKRMNALRYTQENVRQPDTALDNSISIRRSLGILADNTATKRMNALRYTQANVRQPDTALSKSLSIQRSSGILAGNAATKRMNALSYTQTNVRQPNADQDSSLSIQRSSGTSAEKAAPTQNLARTTTFRARAQAADREGGPDTLPGFNDIARRKISSLNASNVILALQLPVITALRELQWIGVDHPLIQQRQSRNTTEQMKTGNRSRRGQALNHRFNSVSEIQSESSAARWGESNHKEGALTDRVSNALRGGNAKNGSPNLSERLSYLLRNRHATMSKLPVTERHIASQVLARNRTAAQVRASSPLILAATLQHFRQPDDLSSEFLQTAKLSQRNSVDPSIVDKADRAEFFNQTDQVRGKRNDAAIRTNAPKKWIEPWQPSSGSGSGLPELAKLEAGIGYALRSGLSPRAKEEPSSLQRTARSVSGTHMQKPADRSNTGFANGEGPIISKQANYSAVGNVARRSSNSNAGVIPGAMVGLMAMLGVSQSASSLKQGSNAAPISPESRMLPAFLPRLVNGEAGAFIQRNRFAKGSSTFNQAPLRERGLARRANNEIRTLKALSMARSDFHINKSDKSAVRSHIARDAAGTTSSLALRAASTKANAVPIHSTRALYTSQQSLQPSLDNFAGKRSMTPHQDIISVSGAKSAISGRSQASPLKEITHIQTRSLSTIHSSMGAAPILIEPAGIRKKDHIATASGYQGSSLQMSPIRSTLQGQGAPALKGSVVQGSTLSRPVLQGSALNRPGLKGSNGSVFQRTALHSAPNEQSDDHGSQVFQRTNSLSSAVQRRLQNKSRIITDSTNHSDHMGQVSTAATMNTGGTIQWQQDVRSDISIADHAKQRMHNPTAVRPTGAVEQDRNKPAFEGVKGRSVLVRQRGVSRIPFADGSGQPVPVRMLRKAATPPASELLTKKSGMVGIRNQPDQGTEAHRPMLNTNSGPQLSVKRISQFRPQAVFSKSSQPTGSESKEGIASDNNQTATIQFQGKLRSLAQAPTSVRPHKWEDTADHHGQPRFVNPGMGAAPGDIFTHSQQQSAALGKPSALLEHKLPTSESSQSEDLNTPILELLRRQRQPESEESSETIQSMEPLELTKEQINELIKQLPQLDVNHIVDKVTRELEKRMRFERQRRGR